MLLRLSPTQQACGQQTLKPHGEAHARLTIVIRGRAGGKKIGHEVAAGHPALNKDSLRLLQHLRLCQQVYLSISLTSLVAQSKFVLPSWAHDRAFKDWQRHSEDRCPNDA